MVDRLGSVCLGIQYLSTCSLSLQLHTHFQWFYLKKKKFIVFMQLYKKSLNLKQNTNNK